MIKKLTVIVSVIMGICFGLSVIGLGFILLIQSPALGGFAMFALIPLSIVCFLLGVVIIVVVVILTGCYLFAGKDPD